MNAYIRAGSGDGFSAKDFRTWSGTVLGAVELGKLLDRGVRRCRRPPGRAAAAEGGEGGLGVPREYVAGGLPEILYRSRNCIDRFDAGETIASALHTLADTHQM